MKEYRKLPKVRERESQSHSKWRQNHPNYLNDWRAKHPEKVKEYKQKHKYPKYRRRYRQENPEKIKANVLAQRIRLEPECEICGATKDLMKHHPDYTEPLVVITCCRTCHSWVHKS